MSLRSMRQKLSRLVESAPALLRAREHAEFLERFEAADARNRGLVRELERRLRTRELARMLPRVAPAVAPELPTDLREATVDDLRAGLSVAMAGWVCDSGAGLPSDAQQSLRFDDGPTAMTADARGVLWLIRTVVFTIVEAPSRPDERAGQA